MFYVVVGLASLGLVASLLPDSVVSWVTDKAGSLIGLIVEPVINILFGFFDAVKETIQHIFFT